MLRPRQLDAAGREEESRRAREVATAFAAAAHTARALRGSLSPHVDAVGAEVQVARTTHIRG